MWSTLIKTIYIKSCPFSFKVLASLLELSNLKSKFEVCLIKKLKNKTGDVDADDVSYSPVAKFPTVLWLFPELPYSVTVF